MTKSQQFVLPLQYFVRRKQVLDLFRQFLREHRRISDQSLRSDIKRQISYEFRNYGKLPTSLDEYEKISRNISVLIVQGERSLQQLKDLSVTHSNSNDINDSWININDPEDTRGRIGTSWPWSK